MDQLLVTDRVAPGEAEEHTGQNAGTSGGRSGHDHSHGRVDFLHGERSRENFGEHGAGKRADWFAHLRGVATDQAAHAAEVPGEASRDRAAHHVQCPLKSRFHLRAAAEPFCHFGAERKLAQRDSVGLRLGYRLGERIVHQATR